MAIEIINEVTSSLTSLAGISNVDVAKNESARSGESKGNISKSEFTGLSEERELYESVLSDAVRKLNYTAKVYGKRFSFGVHEESDRIFVRVTDLNTNEIVKEIPPERVLKMEAKIREYIGLLVDELA